MLLLHMQRYDKLEGAFVHRAAHRLEKKSGKEDEEKRRKKNILKF